MVTLVGLIGVVIFDHWMAMALFIIAGATTCTLVVVAIAGAPNSVPPEASPRSLLEREPPVALEGPGTGQAAFQFFLCLGAAGLLYYSGDFERTWPWLLVFTPSVLVTLLSADHPSADVYRWTNIVRSVLFTVGRFFVRATTWIIVAGVVFWLADWLPAFFQQAGVGALMSTMAVIAVIVLISRVEQLNREVMELRRVTLRMAATLRARDEPWDDEDNDAI